MKNIFIFFFIIFLSKIQPQIFVSTEGNDINPGTKELPYLSITKAISVAVPGDTIYLRGGVYLLSATITISKKGTEENKYYMVAYESERPVLDFSPMPFASANRGIKLSGNYWYIKGIDIKSAGDNGMNISGSNNIIEFCSFYENKDTGLQLGGGASNNRVINCDSYYNADPGNGNADGFAPKLDVGTGNYFYGCRSWQNSDDGWDGYLRGADSVTTMLENCWCFKNGYLKSGASSSGNGNGYKTGGGDTGNSDSLMHHFIMRNCIAFDNRVKGFDENNNRGSITIINCTAYKNGTNFSFPGPINSGQLLLIKNCIALGSKGTIGNFSIEETNSWMNYFFTTADDFISITSEEAYGLRKPDGSLPEINFLHLATGSDLIDSGSDVGLPFYGNAPDLGAFESNFVSAVYDNGVPEKFTLQQNYPNPFNPSTTLAFSIPAFATSGPGLGVVSLKVYDILGNEIAVLVNEVKPAGNFKIAFDGSKFSSGIYFYILNADGKSLSRKMCLLK